MYEGAVIAVHQPGWEVAGQVVFLTAARAWVKVLGKNEVLVLEGWTDAYNRGEIRVLLPRRDAVLFQKSIVETTYGMGRVYWWQHFLAKCRGAKYRPYRGTNASRKGVAMYERMQMYECRQLVTGYCCVDGTLMVFARYGAPDGRYVERYNVLKRKYPGIWERWVK